MNDLKDAIDLLDELYNGPKDMPTNTSNPQLEIIAKAIDRVQTLFAQKNQEYAGGSDILGNFRRLASSQNLPMSTVWMMLAGKHIDAIQEHVKDVRADITRDRTQPITERIDDLIVYALLLQVIVQEERRAR